MFIGVGISAMVILLVTAVLYMANNRAIDAIRAKCENIAKFDYAVAAERKNYTLMEWEMVDKCMKDEGINTTN